MVSLHVEKKKRNSEMTIKMLMFYNTPFPSFMKKDKMKKTIGKCSQKEPVNFL